MATLEELSARLMKAAKDLAQWDCPFSEILEEYHKLLELHTDVNLNKSALVIQSSANVYVRRVEYLFQDTTALIRSFVDQEAADETEKRGKKNGREKKNMIDIIDFEPIDFAHYVAKNINLKNRNGNGNVVKLLGQRFPQLENISGASDTSENERDQDNDGRKYNFRCNQYITASGMLVEHLKPEDLPSCSSPERIFNIPQASTPKHTDSNLGDEIFIGDSDRASITDLQRCAVSTPLPADTENDFIDLSFCSTVDSGRGSSYRDSTDRDGNWDTSPRRPSSNLSIGEPDSLVETGNDSGIGCDGNPATPCKRGAYEENSSAKNSPSSKSDIPAVEHYRRSKRLRSLFDVDENDDSRPLEPIPFDNVTGEVPKSRRTFKLPCPVSLLKGTDRPRKRKIASEAKKRQRRQKIISNESEMGSKKMNVYSPTRQLFMFMKDELEDLSKCFKKYLRNLHDPDSLEYCEAVMNESMDLLGYKSHRDRRGSSPQCETTEISGMEPEITNCADDFPMPDTPESFNSPEPTSPPTTTCDSRIERLVLDIHESSDVRTEQEDAVIRWHEKIQLKIRDSMRKPKFEMADYTARVMKSLENNNGRITFNRMVGQNNSPEAARYLLASLTLANKYDLHIESSGDEGNVTLLLLKE